MHMSTVICPSRPVTIILFSFLSFTASLQSPNSLLLPLFSHLSHLFFLIYILFRANNNAPGAATVGSIMDSSTPNLEEWALLALLAGAGVCEEDTYGINVRTFIDGTYCVHIHHSIVIVHRVVFNNVTVYFAGILLRTKLRQYNLFE